MKRFSVVIASINLRIYSLTYYVLTADICTETGKAQRKLVCEELLKSAKTVLCEHSLKRSFRSRASKYSWGLLIEVLEITQFDTVRFVLLQSSWSKFLEFPLDIENSYVFYRIRCLNP